MQITKFSISNGVNYKLQFTPHEGPRQDGRGNYKLFNNANLKYISKFQKQTLIIYSEKVKYFSSMSW